MSTAFHSRSLKLAPREETVAKELAAALSALKAALAGAEAVGFGDQFPGSLDEAIKQVQYTQRMLS